MVVNCYRLDRDIQQFRDTLREYRNGINVVYAFMDYDQSIQLPLDVSVKNCRRSSDEACMGSELYKPDDVCLGEPEYNPFAFDVAMLGNLFRVHLSVRLCLFCRTSTHTAVHRRQFQWSRPYQRCSTG